MSDGLFRNLYNHLFKTADLMIENNNMTESEAYLSEPVMAIYDSIMSLETLSEGLVTTEDLKNKIKVIFKEGKDEGVCLSTIHKAKGLESDNIFILAKSLMPSRYARQEWEIKSEENLEYVAITRAKKTLQYISELDFRVDRGWEFEKNLLSKFKTVRELLGTKPSEWKRNSVTISVRNSNDEDNKQFQNASGKTIGALKFYKFIRK